MTPALVSSNLTAVEDGDDGNADAGVANAIPANPAKRAAAIVGRMVNLLTLSCFIAECSTIKRS
jgi:hypothetical protein